MSDTKNCRNCKLYFTSAAQQAGDVLIYCRVFGTIWSNDLRLAVPPGKIVFSAADVVCRYHQTETAE